MHKRELLKQARGDIRAEVVLKNGLILDVFNERLIRSDLAISSGIIIGTGEYEGVKEIDLGGKIVTPGFIDAHLHLESAMTDVGEFARVVIPRGTTTVVADPHEIANVAGVPGIKYMLKQGLKQPWNFNLMLPSCVPASKFENSGAELSAEDLSPLYKEKGIFGLGEVMDYPSVINGDKKIWEKIKISEDRFIDGHAPGLLGKDLNAYLLAGIKADHEATTAEEALEKVSKGMYIMIREGSVTRDLVNLLPAVNDSNCSRFFFATDDRHPGDLIEEGHINFAVKKAVQYGLSPLRSIRMATINAAQALGFKDLGAIAPGYKADLLLIDNLIDFNIKAVYKDGCLIAENGTLIKNKEENHDKNLDYKKDINPEIEDKIFNSIKIADLKEEDFALPAGKIYRVIELLKDKIVTREGEYITEADYNGEPPITELIGHNLVKLAVVERHHKSGNVGIGLLRGFGLREGAVATSIGHDAHNIIVAGLKKNDMYTAVKELQKIKGGIVIVANGKLVDSLPLPVAGLMAVRSLKDVAEKLTKLRKLASSLGITRDGPFMTLSFMALSVIPELKLTDQGLFSVSKFENVPLVKNI
ncbi:MULTISPECIES: adenine deaminase [unclassified Halanaerobium]|uniref:adenine deaminase n=1 Tax=unclassified Halanaerobium TaxID=2641197 RepID=UPI000DF49CDE|nr:MULTISPECIES: adenine deaminase [unclassified Halanaerobium]RCW50686.1 adenine deaminase [Halanaerobium sp. MA284_MarDTE_T2]RCW86854.1 adenine deaminase [Halanaerobium sp. DL-01]